MAHAITDRRYLNRSVRSRNSWLIFILVLALGAGALGFANVTGVAKELTATYTSTTGEVIDEGSHRVLAGSRRNRHYEDRRNVTIEYSLGGTVASGTVNHDELQIGDSLTIWVNDSNGDVRVEAPEGPGFWDWTWAIVVPILALLLLWGFVYGVRTSIRMMRFSPEGRKPDFLFELSRIEGKAGEGRRARKRALVFHGVMQTNSVAERVGKECTLTAVEKTMPQMQTYPPRLTGYYLVPGQEGSEPVIYAPEIDAWWTAILNFPSDLEAGSTAQEKLKKSD